MRVPADSMQKVAVKNWTVGLKHITGDHCECIHQPYDPSVDKRNYLNPKNSVYEEAKKIICNKQLLSDIERSCHYYFTSSLESYHSLKLKYAAKRVHYQYPSMECRVLLSILDHNENIHRENETPAVLQQGDADLGVEGQEGSKNVYIPQRCSGDGEHHCCFFERKDQRSVIPRDEGSEGKNKIPKCVAAIKRPKPATEELMARYTKRKSLAAGAREGSEPHL
ncbi:unnamed protein product [Cyprideis torosa]|uniref:Uncharacterized protein n=1 Tax=Cyprideis torosa TaxID=163714 RepID=A0A7R8ZQX1_9CRUS|nr:unnamed protein product [Cyprideis torosa]CAG0902397.1 unnamed protein product [Cyprideis torosa]